MRLLTSYLGVTGFQMLSLFLDASAPISPNTLLFWHFYNKYILATSDLSTGMSSTFLFSSLSPARLLKSHISLILLVWSLSAASLDTLSTSSVWAGESESLVFMQFCSDSPSVYFSASSAFLLATRKITIST